MSTNFLFSKFVDNAQQCFAFTPQANFPVHNLNFHWRWRWWDWIQATFSNLFYFKICLDLENFHDFEQSFIFFFQCVSPPPHRSRQENNFQALKKEMSSQVLLKKMTVSVAFDILTHEKQNRRHQDVFVYWNMSVYWPRVWNIAHNYSHCLGMIYYVH